MKKSFVGLLVFISMSVFASDHYSCEDVQSINGFGDETLVINRNFITKKIKHIDLVTELKVGIIESTKNPFLDSFASNFNIDPQVIEQTQDHTFLKVSKTSGAGTAIYLSQSLIDGEAEGFANYYSHGCFFRACDTYSFYFKCTKL